MRKLLITLALLLTLAVLFASGCTCRSYAPFPFPDHRHCGRR